MRNDDVAQLFNVRSHNPSFFAVRESVAQAPVAQTDARELLDFCIPVNLHFPPPELVEMIRADLGEILRYYPDYAETHQQHLAEMTSLPADLYGIAGRGPRTPAR